MPKVITYKELNSALRALIGDEVIDNVGFAYVGKEERIKLIFKSDPDPIKVSMEQRFKCSDCGHEWGEPGIPFNLNCPACTNENVESLGERRVD